MPMAKPNRRKHSDLVAEAINCSVNIDAMIDELLKEARDARTGPNGILHLLLDLIREHHKQEKILLDMQLLIARNPETHPQNNAVVQQLMDRIGTLEALVQEALKR